MWQNNRQRWAAGLASSLCLAGLLIGSVRANDDDFDFHPITFKVGPHSRIDRPVVTWEVSADPLSLCPTTPTSPTQGQARYSTACMTWNRTANTCTIVTTAKATHAQLGHLLVACMEKS